MLGLIGCSDDAAKVSLGLFTTKDVGYIRKQWSYANKEAHLSFQTLLRIRNPKNQPFSQNNPENQQEIENCWKKIDS